MILLAAALEGELGAFLKQLHNCELCTWRGNPVYTGLLLERPVVLASSGVGKVRTALVLQHLFETYPIERLIFTGIAGGLNPLFRRGDVVVPSECLQHDLDLSIPGSDRGHSPLIQSPDSELFKAASSFKPKGYRIHNGCLLTADRFIGSPGERAELRREFQGDITDMEGAAAAFTADVNGIPWLLIKAVSDEANGELPPRFKNLLARLSVRNFEIVNHILEKLQI